MTPLLSILTPSIPERFLQLRALAEKIQQQIDALAPHHPAPVEHLVLTDNLMRTVGLKRQSLLDSARGDYIAYVDDDDTVSDDYVRLILAAIARGRDVITFQQRAIINGAIGHIDFRLNAPADCAWMEDQTVTRPPWHVCAWRRDLVKDCLFPDINDGEDLVWCLQARQQIKNETHIDAVLHHYRFDHTTTAATGR